MHRFARFFAWALVLCCHLRAYAFRATGRIRCTPDVARFHGGWGMARRNNRGSAIWTSEIVRLKAVKLDGETIRGPITPVGNFILVRTKDSLSATDGGLLLPDQAKERPTEGEVIAAGPGKLHPHTGVRIHNPVKPGMSVVYGKFAGTAIVYNDEDMTMIRDDDVMLSYTGVQMNLGNVTPVRDNVLVDVKQSAMKTTSGIVVAEATMGEYEQCEGIVIKVGEGRMSSAGKLTPSPIKVGEEIKFRDYAGNEVRIQGKSYSAVRMVDILCSVMT